MRQRKTPFCVSNFETKQKTEIFTRGIRKSGYLWICTEKSGYPDKIGMRGRSAVVSIIPPFFPDKKIVNLPGSGFFFFHERKKNLEFRINPEVAHPGLRIKMPMACLKMISNIGK